MSESVKLLSVNVRSLSNFKKRRAIFTWCRKRNADFIFLQETHLTIEHEMSWKHEWGAEIISAPGTSDARGVAVLFKRGVDYKIHSKLLDPEGRYIILKAEIQEKPVVLINVYAPNKNTELTLFFTNLLNLLQNESLDSQENIIIGGDWNCPLDPALDKKGGILTPRKAVISSIDCLQNELDLIDIWRIKNPGVKSFTWSQQRQKIFCRLDYWMISNNLHDCVKTVKIIPAIKTDHSAICLELAFLDNSAPGPGYWKMNCSMLDDDVYVETISKMIPAWVEEGRRELSDYRCVWDWLKYNIRNFSIQHSKRKSKTIKEREMNLQNKYNKAKQRFENDSNDANSTLLWIAQEELETFYEKKVEGIIIRSRARWYEHGERSSKYFLNLEKRNHVKKHIRKLDINGVLTTDPLKILNEHKRFYQELYQSINKMSNNSEIISLFLDNLNIPKLSETDKNSCEGKISVSECHKLLDSFQNNKTPGNDGIPIEFYKKFWSLISDPFINSINECFEKGEMSVSQKQAVITLIEKKGKDRSSLEN